MRIRKETADAKGDPAHMKPLLPNETPDLLNKYRGLLQLAYRDYVLLTKTSEQILGEVMQTFAAMEGGS